MPGPVPSQVLGAAAPGPLRQSLVFDSVRREIRPTHWKEGALIGGVTVGLGLGLLVDALCRNSDTAGEWEAHSPAGFYLGGLAGGVVGALIGSLFPKVEDP